jgi:hypothetical protein
MKQAAILFTLFCIIHCASAQYGCILVPGDSCRVSGQAAEFRTSPNYNYSILAIIDPQNTHATAVILQSKLIRGYAKVMVVSLQGDTAGNGHLLNNEAWVKKGYLACYYNYGQHNITDTSISWNEDLAMAGQLRKQKHCKYDAGKHASLLLDRARARYREEDFEGALDDINHAMDLLPYTDNLIIYHWYRAQTKSELNDLYGAIEDFDYIIDRKDSLEARSYDFNINDVLCWKSQNLYLAGENYKAKSLLKIVLASDPENGFAYYLRGLVKYSILDKAGGCEDLGRAAALGFEEAYEEIQLKCN